MITPEPLDPRRFLEAAIEIVDTTDRLILEQVAGGFTHRLKADRSFVTEVDFAVERFIRSELARRFPGHGIIGEELDDVAPASGFSWVIDPIDGTMSLRHGIPLYGTLLALMQDGEPIVGVVSLPAIQSRAWAGRGLGAFVNGERQILVDLDSDEAVDEEVIAIGERRQFTPFGLEDHFDRLMQHHPSVRVYCDCFGHLLAFQGAVGAMVDYGLRIWDWAASRVIIEEAGGVFEIVGEHEVAGERRYNVILGKPRVVRRIREILK